jgi:hypothetical protein
VAGDTLRLEHPETHQTYRVLFLPGMTTLSAANLARVQQFFEAGGLLIATTRLPDQSAELGRTEAVRESVRQVFGTEAALPPPEPSRYPQITASSVWAAGGHEAALACDGDPNTRWNARDGSRTNQWLEVDFGTEQTFDRVTLDQHKPNPWASGGDITGYKIQYWGGADWKDAFVGGSLTARRHSDDFPPVTSRKVRLLLAACGAHSVVWEFQVFRTTLLGTPR